MLKIVPYQHADPIEDFDGLVKLVQGQLSFIGYQLEIEEILKAIENSRKEGSRSVFFVAYDSTNKACAFAFANRCCGLENGGDYLWLNELYVSRSNRTKGLGSKLLEYIKTWAKKEGCVYLALVTHPTNEKAKALYQQNGLELEKLVWADEYL
ncbi:GNAT family N-acetyltransferase [uncultured Sphaerochaeta sp.]|uniref:GNAT family N-acetyltransferase n=1 Tax=uncultured Sphaerochaeta sp. TaxID=886478 RepID=UPI002A0A9208|nr:GNAT family N-acetyltransferase [uncultured Sphaerochaeta sp.]